MAYRFTILANRFGQIITVLLMLFMWLIVYGETGSIKGFNINEMITYIVIGELFHVVTDNNISDKVAHAIKSGHLSSFLVRPMSYLRFAFTAQLGSMSFKIFFSIFSRLLIVFLFFNKIIFNTDVKYILVIMAILALTFILKMLLSYLVGLIAFWATEVSGLYNIIHRLEKILSGSYFPLAFLPVLFVRISLLMPFAYFFFVPAQLYLKKIDLNTGLKGLAVQVVWIFLLYGIIKVVWKRGLKKYEGVGI